MNNKLCKKMRKHTRATMADDAVWVAYNIKNVIKNYWDGTFTDNGEQRLQTFTIPVKSLVLGCGRQRYQNFKKMYKRAK